MTPDTQRLFLRLFFLTTDVWNNVSKHLWPVLERLSCSGNSLIGSGNDFIWLKLFPCSQNRRITLDGAVWLYCYETALCTKTLFLILDNFHVLWIDFRNYHRHIRCPAVCTVVGNNRCLCLCVIFLDLFDLFFCHVYSRKYKVDLRSYLLYLIYIHYYNILYSFRHRSIHLPTVSHCLLISLSCTSWACCNRGNLKPWMILQQRDKSLSYHTCSAKDTNF